MIRIDKRSTDELRNCQFQPDYLVNPKGSVLIEQGNTRIICAVSVIEGVPRWKKSQGVPGGWVTGEYQMLPGATTTRSPRDVSRGKLSGRSQEIQRLIGRSLRAVVDLERIGNNTVYVDCDVIDADGGTRCASITGASIALSLAFRKMLEDGDITDSPMQEHVAAVSVGIYKGEPILDLCYEEDSNADVDMNVIMTASGNFVEIQGTAEANAFSRDQMNEMLDLAQTGITQLTTLQTSIVNVPLR